MPKQNVNNHFSILKCKPSASTQIDLVGPTKSAFTKKKKKSVQPNQLLQKKGPTSL